jgi:hypothetical protein
MGVKASSTHPTQGKISMNLPSIARITSFATALLVLSGAVFAAGGTVSSVSMTPNAVFPGENVNIKIGVTEGSFGVDCYLRWSLKSTANTEVFGVRHLVQTNGINNAEYVSSFTAPMTGQYTLQVGAGQSDSQAVSCTGSVSTAITVKDNSAISTNAGLTVSPPKLPVLSPGHVPVLRGR